MSEPSKSSPDPNPENNSVESIADPPIEPNSQPNRSGQPSPSESDPMIAPSRGIRPFGVEHGRKHRAEYFPGFIRHHQAPLLLRTPGQGEGPMIGVQRHLYLGIQHRVEQPLGSMSAARRRLRQQQSGEAQRFQHGTETFMVGKLQQRGRFIVASRRLLDGLLDKRKLMRLLGHRRVLIEVTNAGCPSPDHVSPDEVSARCVS